ncbi:phosphatidylserine decarboxylase [Xylona heveae TC161]|uniref:Phosphatidylserine decarboxylase proenzyme 1, mitochondrial n=1 Tax=Xylona heveae (strain CBS 132557 / TC161) TaxID=1328760 RepID=A0A165HZF8_XYLHT|nr:phosphatidylserine decarboxylase [Xylona heveae TC161]KZF24135.1 phosphatidylserine decarboxylase [Xylona heveae TC161]
MAASRVGRHCFLPCQAALHNRVYANRWISSLNATGRSPFILLSCAHNARTFTFSSRRLDQRQKETFRSRLAAALKRTKIQWYPIPVGLGIGFLGLLQFYKVREREGQRSIEGGSFPAGDEDQPPKRRKIRPSGPWQVQIMSTLPLKAVSRLWGWFNGLEIPYYLRVPGFRLYSWIFGVNLSEVSEPDLHVYPNLASFFYRTLKPGVRPLDPDHNALLSPADGRILQYGMIQEGEVEQVKGMTYSLDGLLGQKPPGESEHDSVPGAPKQSNSRSRHGEEELIKADEEFARLNGISYTLPNMFSGPQKAGQPTESVDASMEATNSAVAEVRADLALGDTSSHWYAPYDAKPHHALYFVVVYLAPGDYHRFHSPCSWVAERRRHFAGELYSVSPYLQRTLPGLFTLNERVVLLGRWRWGFFSFTPVGATNVGSIVINFDRELRTNSLLTDTAADRAAAEAAKRGEPYSGFSEATYAPASRVLGGHALTRGEEMGGFQLGSTVVLVFEAPKGKRRSFDEGWQGGERKGGWRWAVEQGQKVKVGQALGYVDE